MVSYQRDRRQCGAGSGNAWRRPRGSVVLPRGRAEGCYEVGVAMGDAIGDAMGEAIGEAVGVPVPSAAW